MCGLVLDDWQDADLDDHMSERPDGKWAASEVDEIASRQNGKNCIVEARELFGCVVLGESIIHTAHLFPTARESYYRLQALVEAHPDVRKKLTGGYASPATGYEMRFRGGGRIRFIARSRTSGRGLTGDMLVFDEFQDLIDDAQGALLPTISARPNAQVWYLGSAPGYDSTVAHRVRTRGRSLRPGRISYKEHSAYPDANLDDRVAWHQGNPGLRTGRILEQTIESEREQMSPEMFARERLSISPDLLEAGGIFGPAWAEVCDPDAAATPEVFAFDTNPERSWSSIVVVGGGVVEVVEYRPGTAWLVSRCKELQDRHHAPFALDHSGPAASFVDELRRNHVRTVELNGVEMTRATGTFYDAVVERSIRVRANQNLDQAVAAAASRPVGDAWAWGRKSSHGDISLLVAATAGWWAAQQAKGAPHVWNLDRLLAEDT